MRTALLASGSGLALLLVGGLIFFADPQPTDGSGTGPLAGGLAQSSAPTLEHVSPRHLSNETAYPVRVVGENLSEGLRLVLERKGAQFRFPLRRVDERLAIAVLDGVEIPPQLSLAEFEVRLEAEDGRPSRGSSTLAIVNDRAYGSASRLAVHPDGETLFVASPRTDEIHVGFRESWRSIPTGDGPCDLSTWLPPGRSPWLVVAHRWAPELRLYRMDEPNAPPQVIEVPAGSSRVQVSGNFAYLSNRLTDAVYVVDLLGAQVTSTVRVGVDPGPVAAEDGALIVGHEGSTDLAHVRLDDEADLEVPPEARISADADTTIIGGHTAPYQRFIMASSAPRDIALSPVLGVAFVADIGPVIGPNPDRMEVSMNGGVGVYDLKTRRVVRHVSILRGVPQALALDAESRILYVADIGAGRVLALDAARLARSDAAARDAILAAVPVEPPPGTRFIRPPEDFSVEGRNGVSIHSGPADLALADGALFVLSRFTGVIHRAELGRVRGGELELITVGVVPGLSNQTRRRFGEVLYYTDLGHTRMSCDSCHYKGHSSGVLFTKGEPMHIYRTPTLLSARESAPYFTPALIPSLRATAAFVLARNRFHNPDPTSTEIAALGAFQETFVQPPNPKLSQAPDTLLVEGRALFEGKGDCARCHPSPQYTTDQSADTRRRLYDVGTAVALPLRPEMQDDDFYPLPAPSLIGLWNNFPLLHSAAGGYSVTDDGRVRATHDHAIERVLELGAQSGQHGAIHELSQGERARLAAYLELL